MWKRLAVLAAVVLAALAAFAGLGRTPPVTVDTVRVTRGELVSSLALTGTLINDRTVTITALLDGEITEIGVREGEAAAAGRTLAALDARETRALLDKARAELALARRRVAAARASHERLDAMAGDVAPQALEDSRLALDSAEAAAEVARTDVRVGELRVENAVVRAPFAGTVTERDAEVGQWVEAGTRLFVLVANDGRVVEAEVDATDFERVRTDQTATLATESAPTRRWTSAVDWIAPAISRGENTAGNAFAIRLPPGEDAPPMLIGQRLDVDLEIDRRDDVATLPLAVLRDLEGASASVLTIEDGVARERAVEIGLTNGETAELVAGLDEGAVVIAPFGDSPVAGERVVAREP